MRAIWGAVVVVLAVLAGLPGTAAAATCAPSGAPAGANPAPAEVVAALRAAAAAADVPFTVLAAIADREGYDADTARNWVQFRADGSPIVAADGGIGMLQLTAQDGFDQDLLMTDWRYNVCAGARVLAEKRVELQANNGPLGPDDPALAENWWAAAYRYNGAGAAAVEYADAVFAWARDPVNEGAAFVPPLAPLATPGGVFPGYDPTVHQFQARAGEAVLADAAGEVIDRAPLVPTPVPLPDDARLPVAPRVAGDPLTDTPEAAAVQLSRVVFADAGGDGATARHVLLARDDDWADALAGAALSGDWGPVLYVEGSAGAAGGAAVPPRTLAELRRVLGPAGRVYLLGGEAAVPPAVERSVRDAGYQPVRLEGPSRIETALAVAAEVRALAPASDRVLVARATVAADALTGGAAAARFHLPLVLSGSDVLAPQVAAALPALGVSRAVVLGGPAALGDAVVADLAAAGLPDVVRAAGATRIDTALAVADVVWGGIGSDVLAVDLGAVESSAVPQDNGWAWALSAGALAALLDAPQVGVYPDELPAATRDRIAAVPGPVRAVVVGGALRVSGAVRGELTDAATR